MQVRNSAGFILLLLHGLIFLFIANGAVGRQKITSTDTTISNIIYVNTAFENASPAQWSVDSAGVLTVGLIYDHERSSPNQANGHWHFQVEAIEGADITVVIKNFDNIWNGRKANPITNKTNCLISKDGVNWTVVPTIRTRENTLVVRVHMDTSKLYFASVEPYRISDLEKLLNKIKNQRPVNIEYIGHTVGGRPLEMIRIGDPNAPNSIVLRARAHSWEPGGNWVVEGLIDGLLRTDASKYLKRYCVYIMPMANKDGVALGRTRFNALGVDLNRKWDKEPDSLLAPEKYVFEQWLKKMVAAGRRPKLALDLHNDNYGNLHVNLPTAANKPYSERMDKLEKLLRKHTWFREGKSHVTNPGSFGEGLATRYGIDACVYEFNYDWIEGLQKDPTAADWKQLGTSLREVFYEFFE